MKTSKTVRIESLEPFETKAHRVIARKAGEVIRMPMQDYLEVKDKCKLLEERKPKEIEEEN